MALIGFEAKGILLPVGSAITGQKSNLDIPLLTMTLARAVDGQVDVRGTTDGSCKSKVVASYSNGFLDTAAFTLQDTSLAALQIIFGSVWETTASASTVEYMTALVPPTSFEIIDAALLTGATLANTQVSVISSGTWGVPRALEIITTGVPTVNQALLNAGATKIVLNSALEGAAIKYGTLQAKTNVLSMGIQNALGTLVGKTLQFSGEGCLTETGVSLWVNTYIQLDGAFSISTGGGDQTVNAKIVTPAGKKDGIEFFAKAA